MVKEGQHLTRDQVLEFNPQWSTGDQQVVSDAIDALPDPTFVVLPSRHQVVTRVAGRRTLLVNPGYLEWPASAAHWVEQLPAALKSAVDEDPRHFWLTLSTFQPNQSEASRAGAPPILCPVHLIALPVTGICDDCA